MGMVCEVVGCDSPDPVESLTLALHDGWSPLLDMVTLPESSLLCPPEEVLTAEAVVMEGYSEVASVDAPQSGVPGGRGEQRGGRERGKKRESE